jgi:hypothetical protein
MPGILDLSRSDPGGILPDWLPRGPRTPAHDLVALGWRGLQALAPNITNPATYAPLPPSSLTPTPESKLPAADRDLRVEGVLHDLFNIGLTFAPMPGAGPAAAARWLSKSMPRAAPTAELLASKSAMLYNPPAKSPRPLSADYPHGATADAAGRLFADIEGRPLVAESVAGRSLVGANEKAISPAELEAIATKLSGNAPQSVAAREIGGNAGRLTWLRHRPDALRDYQILIDRGLTPQQFARVLAHETGHLIDEMAGRLPTAGLNTELRQVYNTLNTGQERTRDLTGPQHLGYTGDSVPRELMVEAIRAYMADPNYLKIVAPKTAAAIREAVNSHPVLSKIIQFNTMAGPLAIICADPDTASNSDRLASEASP